MQANEANKTKQVPINSHGSAAYRVYNKQNLNLFLFIYVPKKKIT